MKNRFLFFFSITAFSLIPFLCGCSTYSIVRTQEIQKLQKETQDLKTEVKNLQVSMGSGFSMQLENVKEQEQALMRMKADLQALITRLEYQLSTLEGSMEESQKRLETIARKTERIDSRKIVIQTAEGSDKPEIIVKEKTEEDKLYKMAYEDFQSGKFDLALEGFKELVTNYPESDLADNAQYWTAEIFYLKKDYLKAVPAYKKTIEQYPKGNKTPSAMYKLGLSYEKMNNETSRDKTWRELIEKYPASNEAMLAKGRLEG